jgi:hypothetical protein
MKVRVTIEVDDDDRIVMARALGETGKASRETVRTMTKVALDDWLRERFEAQELDDRYGEDG